MSNFGHFHHQNFTIILSLSWLKYNMLYIFRNLSGSIFRIFKEICTFAKILEFFAKKFSKKSVHIFGTLLTLQIRICKNICEIVNSLRNNQEICKYAFLVCSCILQKKSAIF